jgi:hypothetical protein
LGFGPRNFKFIFSLPSSARGIPVKIVEFVNLFVSAEFEGELGAALYFFLEKYYALSYNQFAIHYLLLSPNNPSILPNKYEKSSSVATLRLR